MTHQSRRTTHGPALDARFDVPLRGVQVDRETRCAHYDGTQDVIALRFPCCDVYYPCFKCHRETTSHEAVRWPPDRRHERAILCGRCCKSLQITQYLQSPDECRNCETGFNPDCAAHHDRYFAFI